MLDLLETTGETRYGGLLAAFRRGYEAGMAWPDNPMEPFQIGRLLWKINWVARYQPHALAAWSSAMFQSSITTCEPDG